LIEQQPAPGLRTALDSLPRPGGSVLDLGPALAANVAYCAEARARLRVADLGEALRSSVQVRIEELLPLAAGERFDLVLAWDLPNYFARERWSAIAALLAERLNEQGVFHLFARIGAEMPTSPCRYRVVPGKLVAVETVDDGARPAPRFTHADVEKIHPGLSSLHSHLGKHGVQEYVLQRAALLNVPPRAVAKARVNSRR
jgi:hypothetical protein